MEDKGLAGDAEIKLLSNEFNINVIVYCIAFGGNSEKILKGESVNSKKMIILIYDCITNVLDPHFEPFTAT